VSNLSDLIESRIELLNKVKLKLSLKQNDWGFWEQQYMQGREEQVEDELEFLHQLKDQTKDAQNQKNDTK